ncbi:MAG: helix-turn-helix transcriptional regulator [Ruminococcaceae bacterium]|nr:helix-turn-helix transcriptional regulator [Oscillospiraceae bacterium]
MSNVVFRSLPRLAFAHKFSIDRYRADFPCDFKRIEITVITEGELTAILDGKTYTAKKGDILFRYGIDPTVESEKYHSHHTVCFYVDFDREKGSFDIPHIIHSPENTITCLQIIDKIIEASILSPENELLLSGLFLQLLGEVESIFSESRSGSTPGEHRYIERAKKYIYEHISEPILQNDIADYLGITPEYLCYVFKKNEGCSVIRLINKIKLTRIRLLMENNRISLAQASAQYGFSDPNYVSKLYKKYYNENITQAVKRVK